MGEEAMIRTSYDIMSVARELGSGELWTSKVVTSPGGEKGSAGAGVGNLFDTTSPGSGSSDSIKEEIGTLSPWRRERMGG